LPRILRLSYYVDHEAIDASVEAIRNCRIVAAGTDTLYGLLADPFREDCILRVYDAKRRDKSKPLPLLSAGTEEVLRVAVFNDCIKKFVSIMWPGPLTVILRLRRNIFPNIVAPDGKTGFRVPASPVPRLIAVETGGFVTGTSANISGAPPPRTVEEAVEMLGDSVDLYLDTGLAPIGRPSTIIDLTGTEPRLVREGALRFETILLVWRQVCGR
jgi:L-threonylcarbamoyladenylate synthase